MFNIFAALRMLIARDGESMGAVALSAIRDKFIPRLEEDLARETNPAKQEKIQTALDSWKVFSDTRRSEYRLWENIAIKNMNLAVAEAKLSYDLAGDLEQETAYKFYTKEIWKNSFDKVDPIGGPMAFAKWWGGVMRNTMQTAARDHIRKEKERKIGDRVESELGEESAIEQVPQPGGSDLDRFVLKEAEEDLHRYIARKLSGDSAAMLVYKVWMGMAEKKGGDRVNFSRDVQPVVTELLAEKKLPHSHGTVTTALKDVRKTVLQYFEEEAKTPLSPRMKKQLKMAERLAYSEYRRRLASWVLGR